MIFMHIILPMLEIPIYLVLTFAVHHELSFKGKMLIFIPVVSISDFYIHFVDSDSTWNHLLLPEGCPLLLLLLWVSS